MSSLSSMRRYW